MKNTSNRESKKRDSNKDEGGAKKEDERKASYLDYFRENKIKVDWFYGVNLIVKTIMELVITSISATVLVAVTMGVMISFNLELVELIGISVLVYMGYVPYRIWLSEKYGAQKKGFVDFAPKDEKKESVKNEKEETKTSTFYTGSIEVLEENKKEEPRDCN